MVPGTLSKKGYDFEALSHVVIGACIDVELAFKKCGLQFQREGELPAVPAG